MLVVHGNLLTLGEDNQLLPDGSLRIEGGRISEVLPHSRVTPARGEQVIDAQGQLVMPGLICAHTHLARILGWSRSGLDSDAETTWHELEAGLSYDLIRYAALMSCVEAIRAGTTTLFATLSAPPTLLYALDSAAEAVSQSGLRACLGFGVSDRYGVSEARGGVDQNVRFAARAANEPLLSATMALDASISVTENTLAAAVRGAALANCGFDVSLREYHGLRRDGEPVARPPQVMERLRRIGVLGPRCVLVHAGNLTDDETWLITQTRSLLVHCARSAAHSDVSRPLLDRQLAAGLRVGLGSDGFPAAMRAEAQALYLLQRERPSSTRSLPMASVRAMLLDNNAALASVVLRQRVGVLAKDAAADIILLDDDGAVAPTVENVIWQLLFGADTVPVDTTIVAGEVLMRHRRLTHIDSVAVTAHCRRLMAEMPHQAAAPGDATNT